MRRLQRLIPVATIGILLATHANQLWGDPAAVVAYLNGTGTPIQVGSRSGPWNVEAAWTISLSGITSGQTYTFELQDPAFGNALIPPRSNPVVVSSGASLAGYIYNSGVDGYFGWHTQWSWGP